MRRWWCCWSGDLIWISCGCSGYCCCICLLMFLLFYWLDCCFVMRVICFCWSGRWCLYLVIYRVLNRLVVRCWWIGNWCCWLVWWFCRWLMMVLVVYNRYSCCWCCLNWLLLDIGCVMNRWVVLIVCCVCIVWLCWNCVVIGWYRVCFGVVCCWCWYSCCWGFCCWWRCSLFWFWGWWVVWVVCWRMFVCLFWCFWFWYVWLCWRYCLIVWFC